MQTTALTSNPHVVHSSTLYEIVYTPRVAATVSGRPEHAWSCLLDSAAVSAPAVLVSG